MWTPVCLSFYVHGRTGAWEPAVFGNQKINSKKEFRDVVEGYARRQSQLAEKALDRSRSIKVEVFVADGFFLSGVLELFHIDGACVWPGATAEAVSVWSAAFARNTDMLMPKKTLDAVAAAA